VTGNLAILLCDQALRVLMLGGSVDAAAAVAPHAERLGPVLLSFAEVHDDALEDFERTGEEHLVRFEFGEFWVLPTPAAPGTLVVEDLPWVTLRGIRALGRSFVEYFAGQPSEDLAPSMVENDFGGAS
jgi:hypothetical protein